MKKRVQILIGGLLQAGAFASACAGPLSDYYVTTDTQVFHIRGGSVVNSWATVQGQEYPIVVLDNVRTGSYFSGNAGHEYTLGGSYAGTAYAATVPGLHHDGASDGTYNYTTSYWSDESGTLGRAVWRTAADWTAPVKLFDTVSTRPSGIAYDPRDGSTLWISEWDGIPSIRHYTMSGSPLSSFSTDGRYATSLALDPRDGTLWMSGYENAGNFYQYSTGGTILGSTYFPELAGLRTLGGEVPAIPEPGVFALMLAGLTLLGLDRLRRMRMLDILGGVGGSTASSTRNRVA